VLQCLFVAMGTCAEPVDLARLQAALGNVRSDAGDVYRRSWVIVGHVDNNPLHIDVVSEVIKQLFSYSLLTP